MPARAWVLVVIALGVGVGLGVRLRDWQRGRRPAPAAEAQARPSSTRDADAWAAVRARPGDADAWARLADRLRGEGALAAAEAAWRMAIELAPGDAQHLVQLGFTLVERKKDDEARAVLEEARGRGVRSSLLDFTMRTLTARVDAAGPFPRFVATPPADAPPLDDPPPPAREPAPPTPEVPVEVPGVLDPEPVLAPEPEPEPEPEPTARVAAAEADGCALPLTRKGAHGTYLIDVVVDGTEATLILDTGATLTVLSEGLAERAGVLPREGEAIGARTAAGFVRFQTGIVGEVGLAGRAVGDVRVAICPDCVSDRAEGLLGLDVQRPLGMQLDVVEDVVRFRDCVD